MFNFYFQYPHNGEWKIMAITAENVKIAKEKAKSLSSELYYTGDYDEIEADPFEGQNIAWICSTPADDLPFLFKWGKKLALLLAYGTNCQCCLGYRIFAALLLGFSTGLAMS